MKRSPAARLALAPLFALLAAAPSWAAAPGADSGDRLLYIAAAPFALGAIGVVVHLGRSIWMMARPSKPPQAH